MVLPELSGRYLYRKECLFSLKMQNWVFVMLCWYYLSMLAAIAAHGMCIYMGTTDPPKTMDRFVYIWLWNQRNERARFTFIWSKLAKVWKLMCNVILSESMDILLIVNDEWRLWCKVDQGLSWSDRFKLKNYLRQNKPKQPAHCQLLFCHFFTSNQVQKINKGLTNRKVKTRQAEFWAHVWDSCLHSTGHSDRSPKLGFACFDQMVFRTKAKHRICDWPCAIIGWGVSQLQVGPD